MICIAILLDCAIDLVHSSSILVFSIQIFVFPFFYSELSSPPLRLTWGTNHFESATNDPVEVLQWIKGLEEKWFLERDFQITETNSYWIHEGVDKAFEWFTFVINVIKGFKLRTCQSLTTSKLYTLDDLFQEYANHLGTEENLNQRVIDQNPPKSLKDASMHQHIILVRKLQEVFLELYEFVQKVKGHSS